jgi:hypothetical protein
MQTGFSSVASIHLPGRLMLANNRRLSIILKRITLNLESDTYYKQWLRSACISIPRRQRGNSGKVGSVLLDGFYADWKSDTSSQ